MFILRHIRLLSSDSSCSICCSSCGVSVHKYMSSANRRLFRNYPSIFTHLFSQFNLLNMLSSVAVISLGEILRAISSPRSISSSGCRCPDVSAKLMPVRRHYAFCYHRTKRICDVFLPSLSWLSSASFPGYHLLHYCLL